MRLDPLDCRILDQLDRDSRLSCDQIARKLRVSADTVLYHLSKLQKTNVLERSTAIIDLSRLGLLLFRISIRLTKNTALQSIEKRLFQQPYFTLIVEARGEYDLIVWGAAPSLYDIQAAYVSCQEILGRIIRDSSLEIITETIAYSRGYLINRPGKASPSRGHASPAKLDDIELKVLQHLREDARRPVTQIARALNSTPAIVSYRIEKLEKLGVISGYRVHINSEAIGMQRFRVQIQFRSKFRQSAEALRKFCEASPAVTRLEFQVGAWPAELGLETESFDTLHQVLDKLKELAGGAIQVGGIVLFRRTVSAPVFVRA